GKDVDAYIAMLNDVQVAQKSSRAEVLSYSKDQLIDYIVHTYHREQLNMIDEIDQGLAKLLNVHYDYHGEELTKIYQTFLQLKSALVPHFRHEEHVDFPEFKAGPPVDFDELRAE
ncbi:Iron-sulfur cluster repair di-iron protein, partial [human gut metagenome]